MPITVHGDPSQGGIFLTGEVEWREPNRLPVRTCSYCGSVHPEDLVALRDAGQLASVDRSVDWKYGWPHKVYIDIRNPEPERLYVMGRSTDASDTYRPWADLTEDERDAARRDGYDPEDPREAAHIALLASQGREPGYNFGKRPTLHAKFYNIHQAEPDVTDELRHAVGAITGYTIEAVGDGRIRWRAAY